MPSIYLWEGTILRVNGAIAIHEDCCCDEESETIVTTLPTFAGFEVIEFYGAIEEGNFGDADSWDCGFQWRKVGDEDWIEIGFTTLLDEGNFDESIDPIALGLESGEEYENRAIARDDWNNPTIEHHGDIFQWIYDPPDDPP